MSDRTGGRFGRENFNRAGYERELAGLCEAMNGPDVSAPTTASELYELERLVRKYPGHARQILDRLTAPRPAEPPERPAG